MEGVHVRLRPHGNAQMGGPNRPDAADKYLLGGHRVYDLFGRALAVQHKKVGLRRREGIALTAEPLESLFPNCSVDGLALRNQMLVLEAGGGSYQRRNGHGTS